MTADERIEAMLCRWAEAKYDVQNVTKVRFRIDHHGPYSEVTPDLDPYVEVSVEAYCAATRRAVPRWRSTACKGRT